MLRSVDDDTKLRVEEADAAAEVVRGTKAKVAVEEAAARTPSKTGREEKIFMVRYFSIVDTRFS